MKQSDFSRSTARTMSSPPDQGQPEFKFNHSVTEFVPSSTTPGLSEAPMETVPEVRDLTHDAPEFVPGVGFGVSYEEVQEQIPTFNLAAEEFTFTGAYGGSLLSVESEFKPIMEEKAGSLEPVEDISTSDDEELCAENRPLRPEDETDVDSDFEDPPSTQSAIPHSPLRETSVRQHIYNPEFILKARLDDLSQAIPAVIAQFMHRKIEEIVVEGRGGEMRRGANRYPPRAGPVRGPEITPVDPNWRPLPSEEEKKIAEEAKKQTERIKADKTEDEAIRRTIKITLNKLSPANFDKLKEQLLEISKQNEDNLRLMSQGIFDKAWSQVKFTQLYAGLCQYLDDYFANIGQSEPVSASRPKAKTKKNKFREAILNMCQQVFEAEDDLDVTGLDEELAEKKRNLHRDRTLGNVRFIGELYKVNILGQTTLLNCAWDLIDQRLARSKIKVEDLELNEDRLEGVNILLTTVRDKLSVSARVQETMNQMYEELRLIVDRRTDLSTKIHYRLLNLIEERDQMGK